jgi:hypothetical protein
MFHGMVLAFLLIGLGLGAGFWTGSLWTMRKFTFMGMTYEKAQTGSMSIVLVVISMSLAITTTPLQPFWEALAFSIPAFVIGLVNERLHSWYMWKGFAGYRKQQLFVTHALLSVTAMSMTVMFSLLIALELALILGIALALVAILLQVVAFIKPLILCKEYDDIFAIYYDGANPLSKWSTFPTVWYCGVTVALWSYLMVFAIGFIVAG